METAILFGLLILLHVCAGKQQIPKAEGFSPSSLGMKRVAADSTVPLTPLIIIPGGTYWFGSQLIHKDKIAPAKVTDGAKPRKKARVKSFQIQEDCVTNAQFAEFVAATNYKTEAELFGWSFLLEGLASEKVRKEVDARNGLGRVTTARHWMAARGTAWDHPYGPDSSLEGLDLLPVVHISYTDAVEYCAWADMRLPTEKEWEYAARGGRVNQTFPWGDKYEPGRMNIWDGKDFPNKNALDDGFYGPAPVKTFPPNDYGVYNLLGNVWEWVSGGTAESRILRGGSFIDSIDGRFNHIVVVSTRQTNTPDSSASNSGFRCAKNLDTDVKDEL